MLDLIRSNPSLFNHSDKLSSQNFLKYLRHNIGLDSDSFNRGPVKSFFVGTRENYVRELLNKNLDKAIKDYFRKNEENSSVDENVNNNNNNYQTSPTNSSRSFSVGSYKKVDNSYPYSENADESNDNYSESEKDFSNSSSSWWSNSQDSEVFFSNSNTINAAQPCQQTTSTKVTLTNKNPSITDKSSNTQNSQTFWDCYNHDSFENIPYIPDNPPIEISKLLQDTSIKRGHMELKLFNKPDNNYLHICDFNFSKNKNEINIEMIITPEASGSIASFYLLQQISKLGEVVELDVDKDNPNFDIILDLLNANEQFSTIKPVGDLAKKLANDNGATAHLTLNSFCSNQRARSPSPSNQTGDPTTPPKHRYRNS